MIGALARTVDGDPADTLSIAHWCGPILLLHRPGHSDHVLFSDGRRAIQVELLGGSLLQDAVQLQWQLSGLAGLPPKLAALQSLAAMQRLGRLPLALAPPLARRDRLVQALRAVDARTEAATLSDIATALFGMDRVRRDWSGPSDYLRSRTRRIARLGQSLVQGDYRHLLR